MGLLQSQNLFCRAYIQDQRYSFLLVSLNPSRTFHICHRCRRWQQDRLFTNLNQASKVTEKTPTVANKHFVVVVIAIYCADDCHRRHGVVPAVLTARPLHRRHCCWSLAGANVMELLMCSLAHATSENNTRVVVLFFLLRKQTNTRCRIFCSFWCAVLCALSKHTNRLASSNSDGWLLRPAEDLILASLHITHGKMGWCRDYKHLGKVSTTPPTVVVGEGNGSVLWARCWSFA